MSNACSKQVQAKRCRTCEVVKPIDDFYACKSTLDGHLGACKACTCAKVRAVRTANVDAYRTRDRDRRKTPEARAAQKTRAQTEKGKAAAARRSRAHLERYPERHAARDKVHKALKSGRLVENPCEKCGSAEKIHAHHDDYDKPLDVRWLCQKCHYKEHRS